MKSSKAPAAVDVMDGFGEYFADLDDERDPAKTRHALLDVVMITLLAVLCGAETWVECAMFARERHDWLATFLRLSHGPPGKDTFRRTFEALSPFAFQRCFRRWIEALTGALGGALAGLHVAIDGKTLRGALAHADATPLHLVHAYVVEHAALFAQVAGHGKGQELGALPDLLRMLDLRGATVTIDALGCQPEIAAQIVEGGGAYALCVKDNQPSLHLEVTQHLLDAQSMGMVDDVARTEETAHGRREVRVASVVHGIEGCVVAAEWPSVESLVMIERTRTRGEVTEATTHVYISSEPGLSAARALELVRGHWAVENGLHWTLDVAMREDASRIRSENGAQNFALVRRIGLAGLRREPIAKAGVRAKQKCCGWSARYLLSVLACMRPEDVDTPAVAPRRRAR